MGRRVWEVASAILMVLQRLASHLYRKLTFLDAGISQSALEEALLSNMQHGRMSTLSRMSRYL
jgi:hypothetical protein